MPSHKTYLITGGAGFIGSHLVARLLEEQNLVVVVDNLSTGRVQNISSVKDRHSLLIIDDIENIKAENLPKLDGIYNLACPASPVQYQKTPIKTLTTNFNGVLNLLGIAEKNNCTLLQASTSEVYGDAKYATQGEEYRGNVNCFGPRACYDEGKRIAETLLYEHRQFVSCRIARIFNTYGPNMSPYDGRVVSNFIWSALHNEPITIYGEGKQNRSFCYVDDMVDGLIKLFHSEHDEPINLGNPENLKVMDLANKIIQMTYTKSKIEFLPLPVDDPLQRNPNIEKARNILGWEPKISLDEGLEKTIEYFANI